MWYAINKFMIEYGMKWDMPSRICELYRSMWTDNYVIGKMKWSMYINVMLCMNWHELWYDVNWVYEWCKLMICDLDRKSVV